MSGFRPGDVATPLGPLRLTVGALAEIADATGAASPAELADRVRTMGPDTARTILAALLRPCAHADRVDALDAAAIAALMPAAVRCIAGALRS